MKNKFLERIDSLMRDLNINQQSSRDDCCHPNGLPYSCNYSKGRVLCYCPDCIDVYFRPLNAVERQEMDRNLNHSATI